MFDTGTYLKDVFDIRKEEGFIGNGYDLVSLAEVFIDRIRPDFKDNIYFDPENDFFCAYSDDKAILKDFIISFKIVCDNKFLVIELFNYAELY